MWQAKLGITRETKHYFANPRIKIQEYMIRIKPIEALTCTSLILEQLYIAVRSLHTQTHTHSHYRIPHLRGITTVQSLIFTVLQSWRIDQMSSCNS